jgi:heme exporter protein C
MKLLPVNFINKYFKLLLGITSLALLIIFPIDVYMIATSPPDYLQGELVKIMYIHVPAAWLALGIYSAIAFLSIGYVILKNPQLFIIARHLSLIGVCYTLIALITGAIWGKPTWGTWWVWDARLTSMLLLMFIYIGYHSLSNHDKNNANSALIASYYAIASFIIIPIIKFSVDLWSTLHQPSSVFKLTGPSIHSSIFKILLMSLTLHAFLTCFILIMNIKTEVLNRKYYGKK